MCRQTERLARTVLQQAVHDAGAAKQGGVDVIQDKHLEHLAI